MSSVNSCIFQLVYKTCDSWGVGSSGEDQVLGNIYNLPQQEMTTHLAKIDRNA